MFPFSVCLRGQTKPSALVLLLVLAVRSVIIPSRDDGSPSVIVRHVGLVIDEKDQFSSHTAKSECECRTSCQMVGDRCRGYSFNKVSETCRLASVIHPGVVELGGVFVYTLQTGLPPGTKRQEDGLYYILVPFANVTQAEAREQCARLPGYRLAQAKSVETMKVIRDTWYSSEAKLWRDDLRCGDGYPLAAPFEGVPAQCNPNSTYMCCSRGHWCGYTSAHCACGGCVDYRRGLPSVISGDFWLDLYKAPTDGWAVQWSWNDGTALDPSLLYPNEPVVNGDGLTGAVIARYKVHEAATDAIHGYLCQANYDDVTW